MNRPSTDQRTPPSVSLFNRRELGMWKDAPVRETFNNQKVTVVVADDHPLFRDGLVRALTGSGLVEVIAEADDGPSALAAIKEHRPQVALLDHQMPGMDGAQVAAAVLRDELPTRVLLVSANNDSAIVYHALQQGAAGYLPKESSRSEIVNAVLDCAQGRDVVPAQMAAGLAHPLH
jgi:two-component system nitrate/nitrite response regulator NarL